MQIDWLKKESILILGFGREGQASLRYIRKNLPNATLGIADQRDWEKLSEEEKELLENSSIKMYLGEDYLKFLTEYQVIIKSPGINPRKSEIEKAKEFGVEITSATNLFFELRKGKVIAVTGSKGKSTTASMIFGVLREAGKKVELIGNIGRAALDYLEEDNPDKFYVFEMSSYQLEDFKGCADIAVLVSFFPEHLDYHGDLDKYFLAKMQLVANPKPGLKVIYNWDSPRLREYFETYAKNFVGEVEVIPFNNFANSRIEEIEGKSFVSVDDKKLLEEREIKLKGKHNLENILSVFEVAKLLNITFDSAVKAVKTFSPLEHRLELVGEYKGIIFYNDAISTTPESTIAAISALSRDRRIGTLIVGGMDRGYVFERLAKEVLEAEIDTLILLPETGVKIEEEIKKVFKKTHKALPVFIHSERMEDCVEKAFYFTAGGKICLLSCASPSYNLFKNFEERGRKFKEAVQRFGKS